MNPSFEAALAARLLWIDVRCFEGIRGLENEMEAAVNAAYAAVDQLAVSETWGVQRYGENVPPLLRDVPQLAERYKETFKAVIDAEFVWNSEYEYRQQREQYLKDIGQTYVQIERELITYWNEDCLGDPPLYTHLP
jgi:hypothetical protein